MPPKRTNPREKLQKLISEAGEAVRQARLKGQIKDGDRSHPTILRWEALIKRMLDARARSVRRLQTVDQDKLYQRWKLFRQKSMLSEEDTERYREIKLHFIYHPHPEITRIDKQFSAAWEIIKARIVAAIKPPILVRYSAHPRDNLGVPIDNLDEVVVTGFACFVYEYNHSCYRSRIIENPTWLQVIQLANDMIQTCGMEERSFFENVRLVKEIDGIKEMEFVMGS